MNRDSRLFKSEWLKPPNPQDVASRRFPIADTWNAREQRMGMARVDIWPRQDGEYDWCFNVLISCGLITHWRWADEAGLLQDMHETMPESVY